MRDSVDGMGVHGLAVYYADGCYLDVSKTVSASDLCAAN